MRDPDLVSRAHQAAVTLERAWERWRVTHGLAVEPAPPVSSYVGYSIEEPQGRPRVVFGVDASEAELLAALLDTHECVGPFGRGDRPAVGYREARPPVPRQIPSAQAAASEPAGWELPGVDRGITGGGDADAAGMTAVHESAHDGDREADRRHAAGRDAADAARPNAADEAGSQAGDAAGPDAGDRVRPDAGDAGSPDAGDAAGPDAAGPDAGDRARPEAGDTGSPDAGHTAGPHAGDDTAAGEPQSAAARVRGTGSPPAPRGRTQPHTGALPQESAGEVARASGEPAASGWEVGELPGQATDRMAAVAATSVPAAQPAPPSSGGDLAGRPDPTW